VEGDSTSMTSTGFGKYLASSGTCSPQFTAIHRNFRDVGCLLIDHHAGAVEERLTGKPQARDCCRKPDIDPPYGPDVLHVSGRHRDNLAGLKLVALRPIQRGKPRLEFVDRHLALWKGCHIRNIT
jgi:hypothetical protein